MTERRRPLENDAGQGALFGGEAFAPSGPAPAWNRPARQDAPSATSETDAPPFEASVDADVVTPQGREGATDVAPSAGETDAVSPRCTADAEAAVNAPRAFESDSRAPAHGGGVRTPSPFADEIAELERATDVRAPRAPLAGPTLDDVMSRAWEGLARGLPAACPVCDGEVVAAPAGPPRGRCASCGTTIE
jgi:hypothetical protein